MLLRNMLLTISIKTVQNLVNLTVNITKIINMKRILNLFTICHLCESVSKLTRANTDYNTSVDNTAYMHRLIFCRRPFKLKIAHAFYIFYVSTLLVRQVKTVPLRVSPKSTMHPQNHQQITSHLYLTEQFVAAYVYSS